MDTWYFEYAADCSKEQAIVLNMLMLAAAEVIGVELSGGYGIWVPYLSDEQALAQEDRNALEAYKDSL